MQNERLVLIQTTLVACTRSFHETIARLKVAYSCCASFNARRASYAVSAGIRRCLKFVLNTLSCDR